jgi:hypothetical protein
LKDQNLLATEEGFESFLKLIPEKDTVEKLKTERKAGFSSQKIWDLFTDEVKKRRKVS